MADARSTLPGWRPRLHSIAAQLTATFRKLRDTDAGRMGAPILQDLGLRDPVAAFGSTGDLGGGILDKLLTPSGELSPPILAYLTELSESGGPSDPFALIPLTISYATFLHFQDICNLHTT